ncbi:MAG: tRNA (N(6)-L-threonylcarbamoyladenosine(37)-C(2))-methylthiotransferase MtaB [Bacteroidales bacterium]|nr:tRNA (N(6)-L-threonylcarbamoyladenosine(37)-C(2))-methylthiotransferase MtaB [Bacteroidales bacterium]
MCMAKKIALHNLGCPLNFAETSTLAEKFQEQGYEQVPFSEKADVYVINTCTVTHEADRKSRRSVKKARKLNPEAKIVVAGCYAQVQPEKIAALKGVDLILGNDEKFSIVNFIENESKNEGPEIHISDSDKMLRFHPAYSLGDRTRSFLKVQNGCDYHCSYCTIPMARGKSRNPGIDHLVEEARTIADSGVKEIILTGINIGDFGKTTGETFPELIQRLESVPGIERYRIASIEPNLLNDDIIRFVSQSEKFLPHFHIPLQSGSNDILKKMKRRYTREFFHDKLQQIKKQVPDAFVGVDVIVGFPGESEERFQETFEFLQKLDASYYHVFPYSPRPHTTAARMEGQVHGNIIKPRSEKLQKLAHRKIMKFYRQHLGEKRKVLFESYSQNGKMTGYTDNYIHVETDYHPAWAGKIKAVTLKDINDQENVEIEDTEK